MNDPSGRRATRSLGSGLPRSIEAAAALLLLVAASPLLLVVALAVRLSSPGPALFRQQRMGRSGIPFTLIKFRSMVSAPSTDASDVTAAGDLRVTRVGSLLRASKLDELPELWNIVRGDMSWVGPRPEVPRHVDLQDPLWADLLRVRPGLTDPTTLLLRNEERLLCQIVDESEGSVDDAYRNRLLPLKLRHSLRYLEQRSALSDIGVLLRTAWAVVRPGATPSLSDFERLCGDRQHADADD